MLKNTNRYEDIPFDRDEIPQAVLNIENKNRSNLFTWNGQFSPQFIEALLEKYSQQGYVILDPFAGSGTVLYESGLNNLEAYGVEINPSAFYISKSYELINVPMNERRNAVNSLDSMIEQKFGHEKIEESYIHERLDLILSEINDNIEKQIFKTFIVILDLNNKKLNYEILIKKWTTLKQTILDLPFSEQLIAVYNNDAREIPLPNNSIDLVITSPPYINVYNYHQQYRKSMEFLGYDILSIAKSEVGSNRKHRSNRFLTAIQYCLDIALILRELSRVCKDNSRIIFVVGRQSNIRNTSLRNSEIVYLLGTQCLDLDMPLKQERVFQNRYGQMIYEDILHFKNNSASKPSRDKVISEARKIARLALEQTLLIADDEVRSDMEDAISKVEEVNVSPLLNNNVGE